jgi:DNA invertase Pin-like site-specific DNA recombinase
VPLAEFEKDLIRERVNEGLKAARARGRVGGRSMVMTRTKVRWAQAALRDRKTVVSELCKELGVSTQTLYRYVGPEGELRPAGERLVNGKKD